MATQFFLRNTVVESLVGSTRYALTRTRGAATQNAFRLTVAGPVTPPTNTQLGSTATNPPGSVYSWITPPLKAATISGTVTINLRGLENATGANACIVARIQRYSGGALVSDIVGVPYSPIPAELKTTDSARNFTKTPTSTTLQDGDQIVVTVYMDDANAVSMGGGNTVTTSFNGGTAAAAGDAYVTFNEDLAFYGAASGSQVLGGSATVSLRVNYAGSGAMVLGGSAAAGRTGYTYVADGASDKWDTVTTTALYQHLDTNQGDSNPLPGAWLGTNYSQTTNTLGKALLPYKGGSADLQTHQINAAASTRVGMAQFASKRLPAQFVQSGTLKIGYGVGWQNAGIVYGGYGGLWLVNGSTGAIRSTLVSPTFIGSQFKAGATDNLTAYQTFGYSDQWITEGDYLVAEIGLSSGSGFFNHTGKVYAGGQTAITSDGASNSDPASAVEFSGGLSVYLAPFAGVTLRSGASATLRLVPPLPSGVILIGGTATASVRPLYAYAASGSLVLASGADATYRVNHQGEASGSLLLGGSADASVYIPPQNYAYSASGNLVLGGQASAALALAGLGSGALVLGSTARATLTLPGAGSGVLRLGSGADASYRVNHQGNASGALVLGGTALASYTVNHQGEASGSLVLGGSVSVRPSYIAPGAGRMVLGGSADASLSIPSQHYAYSASGSLVLGSGANASVTVRGNASGALSMGGASIAAVKPFWAYNANGAICVASGASAEVKPVYSYAASGSLVLGESASVEVVLAVGADGWDYVDGSLSWRYAEGGKGYVYSDGLRRWVFDEGGKRWEYLDGGNEWRTAI